jgi:hypothetical protein
VSSFATRREHFPVANWSPFPLFSKDFFLTTKLWCTQHRDPLAAIDSCLEELGTDYVDLYLIHWPVPLAAYVKNFRCFCATHPEPLESMARRGADLLGDRRNGNDPKFPKKPDGSRDIVSPEYSNASLLMYQSSSRPLSHPAGRGMDHRPNLGGNGEGPRFRQSSRYWSVQLLSSLRRGAFEDGQDCSCCQPESVLPPRCLASALASAMIDLSLALYTLVLTCYLESQLSSTLTSLNMSSSSISRTRASSLRPTLPSARPTHPFSKTPRSSRLPRRTVLELETSWSATRVSVELSDLLQASRASR